MLGTNQKLYKWLLAAVLAAALLIAGCSGKGDTGDNGDKGSTSDKADNGDTADKGTTIKSTEGDIQLTVGSDWKTDLKLNANAKINAGNPAKEQYVIVMASSKSDMADGATLEDFKELFLANTEIMAKNLKEIETKDITIDSVPAKQVEFTAEASNIKAHYLAFLLGKGNSFYQIVTYSTDSKFADNKEEFVKVGQSFKVLKESAAPPAAQKPESDGEPAVFASDDKAMEITLPAGWKKETQLNDVAQIQASLMAEDKWLLVIGEDKGSFAPDMTVKDYYDIIVENNFSALENATIGEPKNVEIGGNPALQTEIQGELSKVKVAYLLTIVQTPKQFTQIMFWTGQQKMDSSRDTFIEATKTYKE